MFQKKNVQIRQFLSLKNMNVRDFEENEMQVVLKKH